MFGDAGATALEKVASQVHPNVAADAIEPLRERKAPSTFRQTLIARALEGDDAWHLKHLLDPLAIITWRDVPFTMGMSKNLVRLARHSDPEIRRHTLFLLRFVPPTPQAVTAMLDAVNEKDEFTGATAIEALARARVFPEAVVSVLRKAAADGGASSEDA